jgi:hypothetical protein
MTFEAREGRIVRVEVITEPPRLLALSLALLSTP